MDSTPTSNKTPDNRFLSHLHHPQFYPELPEDFEMLTHFPNRYQASEASQKEIVVLQPNPNGPRYVGYRYRNKREANNDIDPLRLPQTLSRDQWRAFCRENGYILREYRKHQTFTEAV